MPEIRVDEKALVIAGQAGQAAQGASILGAQFDERTLTREWQRARERFLFHILTRKGMTPEALRVHTRDAYAVPLNQFFDGMYTADNRQIWPMIDPWTVTSGMVLQWKQTLGLVGKAVMRDGVEVGRTGLAASTINLKMAALKEFYDFVQYGYELAYNPAVHDPYMAMNTLFFSENRQTVMLWNPQWRNPFDARAVERMPVQKFDRRPGLSPDEVAAILNQINTNCLVGKRDFAVLMSLFSTGCRYEEILERKWGEISEKPDGNYVITIPQGKSGKPEWVELKKRAYQYICEYLRAAGRLEEMQPEDYVFTALDPGRVLRLRPVHLSQPTPPSQPSPVGTGEGGMKPLSNSQVNRMLKKYARRADVDLRKAHCHGLRAARAEQIMQVTDEMTGEPSLVEVNKILRHSSLNTSRIYTQGYEQKKKLTDKWGDAAIDQVVPKGNRRPRKKTPTVEQGVLL